jgi:cobalamin biosynthesis Mg chelatase CobN
VLAVLAMACFPGLAQAEESVGPVYETEVPTVTGKTNPPKKHSSSAKSSASGGATAPDGSGASNPGSSSEGSSVAANPGSGGDGGTGQGSPGNGTNAGDKGAGTQQSQVTPSGQPDNAESASDGDSSSPLVPILIAVAALAAISIGAFVIRQRRRGAGPQVSPKAS